jgi:hypothetical protein
LHFKLHFKLHFTTVAIVRGLVEGTCKKLMQAVWARPPLPGGAAPSTNPTSNGNGGGGGGGERRSSQQGGSFDGNGVSSSGDGAVAGGADPTAPVSAELYAKCREEPVAADASVKTLMRQTSSLHRALSDLFTHAQRDAIFARIAQIFAALFCKYFSRLDATQAYVQRKLTANTQHVLQWLRSLQGTDDDAGHADGAANDACQELTVFLFDDDDAADDE